VDANALNASTPDAIPVQNLDVAAVLLELSELGPPSEIRRQAPALAARTLALDSVVLTSAVAGNLIAEALHFPPDADPPALLARLRGHPIALEYPLVEGEILRRRRPELVHAPAEAAAPYAFANLLGWSDYVTSPIVLDGRVVGFIHGQRGQSHPPLSEADAHALAAFAMAFGVVFERAVLRMRLRSQRDEMRQIAAWADTRTAALGERLVSLGEDEASIGELARGPSAPTQHTALRDLLTRRELEVLELMVRGDTNATIARELVLSAGTVKFHVKNILRKLHASNRAEATSRYLRMTLGRGD
jgi:DNA-binding CsgD family transcriptional regulator